MRPIRLYHNAGIPSSTGFNIPRGGLLRHIYHTGMLLQPGVGDSDVYWQLKLGDVTSVTSPAQDTITLSTLFLACEGSASAFSGLTVAQSFYNFVDIIIPDDSTVWLTTNSFNGAASGGLPTVAILWFEDLPTPRR